VLAQFPQAMEANKTFVDMIVRIHNIAFIPFNRKQQQIYKFTKSSKAKHETINKK
jgi:hypothetical protein